MRSYIAGSGGVRVAALFVMLAAAWGPLTPASARGEEGEERRFVWRPSVQTRALLTDNKRLSKTDEEGDLGVWVAPRIEAHYRTPAYRLGVDGSVDVRRYSESRSEDETFYRVNSFAEAGLLPGLSVRVSDAFTPQPVQLGLPDDDPLNLVQTNRADLEARYWRELPGSREITVGAVGSRFDSERFATFVDAPGGGVALDPNFSADFWEGAGFVEFQNPLGDQHAVYLRGLVRQRDFDHAGGADHLETSGLLGFRTNLEQGLEFDASGGYGLLDLSGAGSETTWLARASLSVRRPGGWRYHAGFHNQFTVDVAGNDFVDTTGRLGVEKYFGPRTAVSVTGFLSQLDSESTSPSYNLFGGAEVKIRRALSRQFQASLAYRYWENSGSWGADNMNQNRIMLSLTFRP